MPAPAPPAGPHGSLQLPSLTIDSYNVELRDPEGGFLGDRASNRAFRNILEDWRERYRENANGEDPIGEERSSQIAKKALDGLMEKGDPEAAGLVLGAVEDFAQELASVTRRFLRAKGWKDTERIVVGGGLRESRLGEVAIGRASVLLKANGGVPVDLVPIRHHPDEAALIGAAHLMPSWVFAGHDSLLAVDIGGTNIRAGVVLLRHNEATDPSRAEVWRSILWRHRTSDSDVPTRDQALERLVHMLQELIGAAGNAGLNLSPFIGVGCPGLIAEDGRIERGGQNLPGGNWESRDFKLADSLQRAIPAIAGHDTLVLVHNDAVMQGLSELPFMQDVERWGVLTIGTGLGNARFTNVRDGAKH